MIGWNGFRGAARHIDDIDLPRIGRRIGVGEDEIHAFMEVEAAGSGFDGQGRPKMLFEPHVFWRQLSDIVIVNGKKIYKATPKRNTAVTTGLAYEKWGATKYPPDSYTRLGKAMAIDETAALKSSSWGLGQVLGENYKAVGYSSVQSMVGAFMEDEEAHLEAMIQFLIANHIDDDLRAHRWSAVARVYNGPGYKTHNYDGRMAAAFAKWQRIRDTPWSPSDAEPSEPISPPMEPGPIDRAVMVREAQMLLAALGYDPGPIDGIEGKRTTTATLAYQKTKSELADDGIIGPQTLASLREDVKALSTPLPSPPAPVPVPPQPDDPGPAPEPPQPAPVGFWAWLKRILFGT